MRMKMMKFKIFFTILLFGLLGFISFAQENINEFERFKEKYNSPEFTYTIEEEKAPKEPANIDFFDDLLDLIASVNWTYVLYTLIGLVFLLVIYKLYRNGVFFQYRTDNSVNTNDNHFDYIENNLLSVDLIDLINKAKSDKDYRLAIRYYHYQNTQNLAQKGYITWDPKKTNQQLINEIKQENFKKLFQNNTSIFNQVWFGNFNLEENNFNMYEANFKYLNQVL